VGLKALDDAGFFSSSWPFMRLLRTLQKFVLTGVYQRSLVGLLSILAGKIFYGMMAVEWLAIWA
jgi:hypothetical protein